MISTDKFKSVEKYYYTHINNTQPGNIVMITAGKIDHLVVQYSEIGSSFILFGRVNSFEVIKDSVSCT